VKHDVVDAIDLDLATQLLAHLAHERVGRRLAGLHLAAGELPEARHRLIGAAA
jgi:hypothetical protein